MFKDRHSLPAAGAKPFLVVNKPLCAGPVCKVADVLEREASSTVRYWVARVRNEPQLFAVHLNKGNLCAHLPGLFRDLLGRLRFPGSIDSHVRLSISAAEYGFVRYQQGYSLAMMVEESRLLVLSIIETLQKNLNKLDLSQLLTDVMVITDEINAQLAESISSYVWQSKCDVLPSEEKANEGISGCKHQAIDGEMNSPILFRRCEAKRTNNGKARVGIVESQRIK